MRVRAKLACKEPKNKAELEAWKTLKSMGWMVMRRGWPDFACFRDGKLMLVEVKRKRSQRLKGSQRKVMEALSIMGVECCKWSPDGGFEKV